MIILFRNIYFVRIIDFKYFYVGGLRDQVTYGLVVFIYVVDFNNNYVVILKKQCVLIIYFK